MRRHRAERFPRKGVGWVERPQEVRIFAWWFRPPTPPDSSAQAGRKATISRFRPEGDRGGARTVGARPRAREVCHQRPPIRPDRGPCRSIRSPVPPAYTAAAARRRRRATLQRTRIGAATAARRRTAGGYATLLEGVFAERPERLVFFTQGREPEGPETLAGGGPARRAAIVSTGGTSFGQGSVRVRRAAVAADLRRGGR